MPIVFAIIVAFVGVARVAVGAHYPSDVLAGLLGGIGVVALFALADVAHREPRAATTAG